MNLPLSFKKEVATKMVKIMFVACFSPLSGSTVIETEKYLN